MKLRITHGWDISPRKARELQNKLARQVVEQPPAAPISTVAGIDVGIRGDTAQAAVVVLKYPSLEAVETAVASRPVAFPYVPGFLSFREGPAVLDAVEKLSEFPDLMIFDGQGRAHPHRLGIASHMGVLLDLPTIGCAKSRLCGRHEMPDEKRGSHVPLVDKGEIIGAVLRTRSRVKPVFVSPGHLMDVSTSIYYVLSCCRHYRLPETTRHAHRLATAF